MPYPIEDAGFTLWHSDLDERLQLTHGVTSKKLGLDRKALQNRYYGGESVFVALDHISRQFCLAA
ncbi:MAG: hypothetical protein K2Q10_08025 [Rhodospirillales bacterium]|nr:hypothetical protein [Rhodospirillales bacterium]